MPDYRAGSKYSRCVCFGSIVRQNISFALAIKAVFLVLAVAGQATLWMAVAADMGASLAVIANGLRAIHSPKPF